MGVRSGFSFLGRASLGDIWDDKALRLAPGTRATGMVLITLYLGRLTPNTEKMIDSRR